MNCYNLDGEELICAFATRSYSGSKYCSISFDSLNSESQCSCPIERAEALAEQLLNSGDLVDVFVSVARVEEAE